MRLLSSVTKTHHGKTFYLVSLCLICAFLYQFVFYALNETNNLNNYNYSEFLINFQGGFVRRGLLGEFLYQTYKIADIPISQTILILSLIFFLFVLYFFFRKFRERNYCWWILLSPLVLGMSTHMVRKDYILYTILIGTLYLLRKLDSRFVYRLIACFLIIFGLFLHEAFIFFGFPIYALMLCSDKKYKLVNILLIALPICIFLLLCAYKGTQDTAHAIVDSWNSLLPNSPLRYESNNSIGAIGWDSFKTFIAHLRDNIEVKNRSQGVILLPLYILAAYYLITNSIGTFRANKAESDSDSLRLVLSLLYSFAIICLIPMFTILSCDTGRVFQYASIVTFGTFLIIPKESILNIFPTWYKRVISQFNTKVNNFLPPSRGLLIILLLFIGVAPAHFSLQNCWLSSVIGQLWTGFYYFIK